MPPPCIHITAMNSTIITPIHLDVRISTQGKHTGARATINSTCEGILANEKWVEKNYFPTYTLSHPICVRNIDNTINKASLIKQGLDANLMVQDQRGRTHTERVQMFITNLGKDDVLLGTDWLKYHDPSIGWKHREVHFDQCPQNCQQPHGFTKAREEPSPKDRLQRLRGECIEQRKKLRLVPRPVATPRRLSKQEWIQLPGAEFRAQLFAILNDPNWGKQYAEHKKQ